MHVDCELICAGRDEFSKGNGFWPPQPSHHHHLNECSSSRVISLYINYFLIWGALKQTKDIFFPVLLPYYASLTSFGCEKSGTEWN